MEETRTGGTKILSSQTIKMNVFQQSTLLHRCQTSSRFPLNWIWFSKTPILHPSPCRSCPAIRFLIFGKLQRGKRTHCTKWLGHKALCDEKNACQTEHRRRNRTPLRGSKALAHIRDTSLGCLLCSFPVATTRLFHKHNEALIYFKHCFVRNFPGDKDKSILKAAHMKSPVH